MLTKRNQYHSTQSNICVCTRSPAGKTPKAAPQEATHIEAKSEPKRKLREPKEAKALNKAKETHNSMVIAPSVHPLEHVDA